MFCNQCGHRNPAGANFCSSCGAGLETVLEEHTITFTPIESSGEVADQEITVALGEVPEGVGVLVVKRGPNAGSRYVLDGPVTSAGRHPESDIFLDDITVSRRHAEIVREADGYLVRDAGSLNGTYLNRERIESQPLGPGDEVQIGKFRLVFVVATGEG